MWKLINEMCSILGKMREFEVCTTTNKQDRFLLDFRNIRDVVSIKKFESGDVNEDLFSAIDRLR